MSHYRHVQTSRLAWLIAPIFLIPAAVPIWVPLPDSLLALFLVYGLLGVSFVLQFTRLVTEDLGDALQVHFGNRPLPLLNSLIRYNEVTSFARDRLSGYHGLGMHYVPGGWIIKVAGPDCVRVTTPARTLWIGTDDPEGLLELLAARMSVPDAGNVRDA
jgi:hypothetical protein